MCRTGIPISRSILPILLVNFWSKLYSKNFAIIFWSKLCSLLQNLTPPAMSRTLHLLLRAHRLLTQTTAFTHLLGGLGPQAFGPAVELGIPIPSNQRRLMFAYSNINGVAWCRDSHSPSKVPYHYHMQGKQYKTPCHKKYLTKIPSYWKMASYPLIKEGQLSHKNINCAGTPMFYTTGINQLPISLNNIFSQSRRLAF